MPPLPASMLPDRGRTDRRPAGRARWPALLPVLAGVLAGLVGMLGGSLGPQAIKNAHASHHKLPGLA